MLENLTRSQFLVKLFRPYNTRSSILFYFIGRSLDHHLQLDTQLFIYPVIFILTYGYASVLNYITDIRVDLLNHRDNPLINNKISMSKLSEICRLLIISSLLISVFISIKCFLVASSLLIFGYLYSNPKVKLSYHALPKMAFMLLTYCLIPLIAGLSVIDFHNILLIFAFTLLSMSWLVYSDIKDIAGDKQSGKHTIANTLGISATTKLSFLSSVISLTIINLNIKNTYLFYISLVLIVINLFAVLKPVALSQNRYSQRLVGYSILSFLIILLFSLNMIS